MPELAVGGQRWQVAAGVNLLDALNGHGVAVPSGCRAGHCHSCRVRCIGGEPHDQLPQALPSSERAAGWRLACQCRVVEDLEVVPYDPRADGIDAQVSALSWPSPCVLRLRVIPARPLRYQPGQHVLLWSEDGIARPYSLASLPGDAPWLEFHLQCARPGAFADRARALQVGDRLRLGEVLSGPLHYDPAWEARPLWLLASGTGLAPLWAVLREALRQNHQGPIRVLHMAAPGEHYLAAELQALAASHPALVVDLRGPDADLGDLRPSRQAIALACGAPTRVEAIARRMFMAGLPRNQLFTDTFDKKPADSV
ncbi:iron-sulfur-binding ferredoxin reductase [Pseudomonas sp. RIT-PI-S]|uniref:iron-sulfur-binding ferredoxin reductase n=1 Tax=Pseudomonas sp. RIT-PI-S TaxID=3035295 RepID=UPI0021D97533|nr:iron-sulfur-binding ferredoxin reductase [Pseudomonas sp. RIT-PI-S]